MLAVVGNETLQVWGVAGHGMKWGPGAWYGNLPCIAPIPAICCENSLAIAPTYAMVWKLVLWLSCDVEAGAVEAGALLS